MSFKFPELPYSYDALEPHIDAQTMELHYSKHHKGYFDKFMNAIKGTELENKSLEDILANISNEKSAVRNNGGGYYNHTIFWNSMAPKGGGKPSGELGEALNKKFGGLDQFKEKFTEAATTRFGSGFAWLIVDQNGNLDVTSTQNQDNPLMDTETKRGTPILCLDVWEHAYYLKYQNKRPEYVGAFWEVVNWEFAEQEYKKNVSGK